MNSSLILKDMDEAEARAYNFFASEPKDAKRAKLYKALKALQAANETKRFLLLVK